MLYRIYNGVFYDIDELKHHGIKGMKCCWKEKMYGKNR